MARICESYIKVAVVPAFVLVIGFLGFLITRGIYNPKYDYQKEYNDDPKRKKMHKNFGIAAICGTVGLIITVIWAPEKCVSANSKTPFYMWCLAPNMCWTSS
jgi:preprotein translocase subunit Sss1